MVGLWEGRMRLAQLYSYDEEREARLPSAVAARSASALRAAWREAAPTSAGPRAPDAFEPAASFAGARAGFVFKKGPSGLGYYRDPSYVDGGGASPEATGANASIAVPAALRVALVGGLGAVTAPLIDPRRTRATGALIGGALALTLPGVSPLVRMVQERAAREDRLEQRARDDT